MSDPSSEEIVDVIARREKLKAASVMTREHEWEIAINRQNNTFVATCLGCFATTPNLALAGWQTDVTIRWVKNGGSQRYYSYGTQAQESEPCFGSFYIEGFQTSKTDIPFFCPRDKIVVLRIRQA
jgi:hypothetical protein